MLVARVYSVLDTVVAEVTCHHPGNPEENHLVIRETRTPAGPTMRRYLRALGDVADLATLLEDPCDAD